MIRFLQTQGRFQKWMLGGILAFVSVMMCMYLVPGFLDAFSSNSSNPDVVATVGSHDVTGQEVTRVATNMVRRQFPRGAPPQLVSLFQDQAMQQLVVQRVFLNEAHRLGLDATDEELRSELQHGPFSDQLFPDGNFIGADGYRNWVQAATNLSVDQFEKLTKESITIGKLVSVVQGGATVSPDAVKAEYVKQNTKAKIDYAYFTLEDISKSINPSDTELKAYYEKSAKMLENTIPEQRKARYILIDAANLPGTKVTDDDLKSYYQQHQDEFRVQASAQVRHILIGTGAPGAKPDQKAIDAAKAKAEDILKQLKGGAKFADLAKKNSEDPGSKDKGGELGTIIKGQTVKPFEDAVFSAKVGDIVGPVQSEFGFHIIQVEQRTDPHLKSLDEVKAQIVPIVARQKSSAAAQQLASTVQTQARTESIDKAAAANSLQVVNTDWFDRNASLPGIGNVPAFMDAVFTTSVNGPSTAVQIPQGWAIVQAIDKHAPRTPTFDEAKARLAANYKQERAQMVLKQKGQELADKAHSLHNLKDAAKQLNATFKTSDLITPTQSVADLGVLGNLADISAMKPGEISNAVEAGRSVAVLSLVEKQMPSDEDFAKNKDQIREQLLDQKRNELLQVYVSNLKDKMEKDGKIKIFQKNLDRLSKNAAE